MVDLMVDERSLPPYALPQCPQTADLCSVAPSTLGVIDGSRSKQSTDADAAPDARR
jgi:hypothetical protein